MSWLARTDVPLFLSAHRLRRQKKWPQARGPWALDSGGFTALSTTGRWDTTPQQYADEVMMWSDAIGGLQWVAPQDWMCEPIVRDKTGKTVDEHQHLTCQSVLVLRALMQGAHVIPVLQGWQVDDYERHVAMYLRYGVDLRQESTVGVGTVCRRQSTREGTEIIEAVTNWIGERVHGFGFKRTGLAKVGKLLRSADSLAWSYNARRQPPLSGCTHGSCANCLRWALRWREQTIHQGAHSMQLQMFGGARA